VSGGELYRVLQAGVEPQKVVFAGVGKTQGEIEFALEKGIRMFNVESRAELQCIRQVAGSLGRAATAALRINPDVDARTHRKTTTGKAENKFGVGLGEAVELIQEARAWEEVELCGLHLHLGSPIYSAGPYVEALEKLCGLVEELSAAGCRMRLLNLGGGYCISYTGEPVIQPRDYAKALESYLERLECDVIIEPGRYIAGNSGVLLTRVIRRKESEYGRRFIICDAAMNDLVRPTLYDAFHRIWPVSSPQGMPPVMKEGQTEFEGFPTEVADVVGPVCETGDYLAQQRALPPMSGGDLLAVFSAGAYGFTMSSNYNSRPRPTEVLVEGGEDRLVRRRETYADLVTLEKDYL
jgi:diaminopimelate decarboxylase